MRHRALDVDHFFLAGKPDGGVFTDDEAVLVLFASRGAAAIANAYTHRGEQQVHADLADLVEITPLGVAVFDAAGGCMVSLNRETTRFG